MVSQTAKRKRPAKAWKKDSTRKILDMVPYVNLSSNSRGIIGERFATRLQYFDGPYVINPGVLGAYASQIWQVNSLYDPDTTGVGHQPNGFDQMMVLYKEYVVRRAYIELEIWNSDNTQAQMAVLSVSNLATPYGDIAVELESGNSEFRTIGVSQGGQAIVKMKKWIDISKFMGTDVTKDDVYVGTAAASPNKGCYVHLGVTSQNNADSAAVYVYGLIKFDVEFRSPNYAARS